MSPKKRGLGKGLDALLGGSQAVAQRQPSTDIGATQPERESLSQLPVDALRRGVYQPRRDMANDALEELASSIKAQGVIQPIIVRQLAGDRYEIIAGERRWRAAQMAGLDTVPCLIKQVEDNAAVAIALIENIQREDLNAMEEAIALKRLADEFELTHAQVAEAVGKSRATVTNLMRLNSLNEEVKTLLEHGDLEMGHARALLALNGDAQTLAARQVAGKEMTVRDTEKLVQKLLEPAPVATPAQPDPDIARLAEQLTERLGAQVAINHGRKGKGKLVINYTDLDQLDGILIKLAPELSER
ncbi:chromosome segregation DNA-binding protein [Ferrimonas balearica DSM 9799]|uniref:Probable chromosome-partitioning protein ParB n=1 Tax=Ferrimonas balearica (strain DSM 9799 / CCM 4581 / KCTC 23876 / PAT) TaxID=550540 RepID=E1SR57_FERBD|nr:ParB/RepB/Spo0J family partition protein [Ferrimonas balearica]MBY6019907.1 ParB/RepB/Spo0J family partition protein [Halomonas denitrificans]ADN77987.1 chromosome segregation DNA-binding protein [Ferrimonas balearica DSM 9799]MBW3141714.1 ParB/RepB/Spo0J family partition protein [Ferrimonas balearica]MBY5982446.1 ParB/RepB/Spo0J family partition protein [Ferrimonas balearica]MBY6097004.1 ParB/RepB/Spo0J family partition protein [Ferrimonas balearica]